jgi:hypothetical protein
VSGLSDLPGLGIGLWQPLTNGTTSTHQLRRNNKVPNKIKKRNEHDKKHKNLTVAEQKGERSVEGEEDIRSDGARVCFARQRPYTDLIQYCVCKPQLFYLSIYLYSCLRTYRHGRVSTPVTMLYIRYCVAFITSVHIQKTMADPIIAKLCKNNK